MENLANEPFIDMVIISGHFLHNHSTFSNMDPYVAFEHNNLMYKTTVKKDAGLNATWNERFRLKPLREPNEIFLQVFANGLITDQFVGESGMLKLKNLDLGTHEREVALFDKDKRKQGKIKVKLVMRDHDTTSEEGESESSEENSVETPEVKKIVVKSQPPPQPKVIVKEKIITKVIKQPPNRSRSRSSDSNSEKR